MKKDKEYYQKCLKLIENLLDHIKSKQDDMIKVFLHKDVERIEKSVVHEIEHIETLEKSDD